MLVAVLVVLFLTAAMAGAVLRLGLVSYRQAKLRERAVQQRLLATSAFARAEQWLLADAAFMGETWDVAAAELGSESAARIEITVLPMTDSGAVRKVRVQVAYPWEPESAERPTPFTREAEIELLSDAETQP